MINSQLLDYIKQQLLKGEDKEIILNELLGSGWAEKDIQEGFNTVNVSTPAPKNVLDSSLNETVNVAVVLKPKKHLLIKIVKYILLIIAIIWVGLEIFNFFEYVQIKNEYIQNSSNNDPVVRMYSFKPRYEPVILQEFYNIFPSQNPNMGMVAYKPVVYLYPTQAKKVKIELDYKGRLIADYPTYDYSKKGWEVTAYPDGKIINIDGKEYSYLFWEGKPAVPVNFDLSTGFIVKGEDTVKFLQNTLSKMGLTPKEYNEFIVYWYPKMKDNKYNFIHFAGKEYTDTAPLVITPTPDSVLRVFMVFKSLNETVEMKPQEIKSFKRTGFSVVEWGGTELGE